MAASFPTTQRQTPASCCKTSFLFHVFPHLVIFSTSNPAAIQSRKRTGHKFIKSRFLSLTPVIVKSRFLNFSILTDSSVILQTRQSLKCSPIPKDPLTPFLNSYIDTSKLTSASYMCHTQNSTDLSFNCQLQFQPPLILAQISHPSSQPVNITTHKTFPPQGSPTDSSNSMY